MSQSPVVTSHGPGPGSGVQADARRHDIFSLLPLTYTEKVGAFHASRSAWGDPGVRRAGHPKGLSSFNVPSAQMRSLDRVVPQTIYVEDGPPWGKGLT